MRPPRLAQLVVWLFVAEPDREFLLGDLDEQFAAALPRDGRGRATLHYWNQAMRSAWHARTARRHRAANPHPASARPDMFNVLRDARLGIRTALRSPGYSAVAVLTMALAIGANTLIFSIANPLVLRPLPIRHPNSLGWVWNVNPERGIDRGRSSIADVLDWRATATSFSAIAAYDQRGGTLTGHGDAERVQIMRATANLPDVWGLRAATGRLFETGEDTPGHPLVAALAYHYWQKSFQADPTVVGRQFLLDGTPLTIIGVMPADIEIGTLEQIDLWTPLPLEATTARDDRTLRAVGMLAPGATLASADREITRLAAAQARAYPKTNQRWDARVVSTNIAITGDNTWVILGLLGVIVTFVLLIACANLANLTLARVVSRRQELAVRLALGASRLQLIRPLILESVFLGVLGGLAGLALAWFGVRGIQATAYDALLRATSIDRNVLIFNGVLSILTPILFSLWPALTAGRGATADTLRETRGSSGRKAGRSRQVLLVAQVAMALSLLVVSGLLVQSELYVTKIKLGLDADRVLTFRLELPLDRYTDDAARARFVKTMTDELAAVPGAEGAGAVSTLPLFDTEVTRTFTGTPHDGSKDTDRPWASWFAATPGFFKTTGVALVAGRGFQETDGVSGQSVAVLSRSAAEKYFDRIENAVGRTVVIADRNTPSRAVTIVGVCADTRNSQVIGVSPQMYVPMAQWPMSAVTVVMRSPAPDTLSAGARAVMRRLDPFVGVPTPKSMHQMVEENLSSDVILGWMLIGFAGLALALAAAGLYGVMSYTVGQRRREIGVRLALGAAPAAIRRMILVEGLQVTGVGIGIGLLLALLLAKASASALYGVRASDPATYVVFTAALVTVAIGALWEPALRAMRVDPVTMLRSE
jgi:predicted permease